jgi:adenosine deaminase
MSGEPVVGDVTGAFVRGMPKAELHMHVEGSLEPELMFALAERNGVPLRYGSVDEVRQAHEFTDLQSFLDLYYEAMRVLRTEEDFYDLTRAYLERIAAENVRRTEVFFDPQAHTERGVLFEAVLGGIEAALADGERELGVSGGVILCFLRHLSPEEAMETLQTALPHASRLLGVGLDSSEVGFPPGPFRDVFARARAEGLHSVVHAGEEGPPEYVWGALEELGAERIDHGVRSMGAPDLVARLAAERVPLTVCPLSNVRLRGVERMEEHPLKRMLDAGLCVTVNSDDPAYFGGYVSQNFVAAAGALNLSRDDLYEMARNSFEASFLDAGRKARLIRELDEYVDEEAG